MSPATPLLALKSVCTEFRGRSISIALATQIRAKNFLATIKDRLENN